jgi:WD40 repeat protein
MLLAAFFHLAEHIPLLFPLPNPCFRLLTLYRYLRINYVSLVLQWLKWHPRGHLIIAGSEDCNVWMWNADHNAFLNTFAGHSSTVTCGDFTPDGTEQFPLGLFSCMYVIVIKLPPNMV